MSVENCLEREIAYRADFFQSQVPPTKRYPVYAQADSQVDSQADSREDSRAEILAMWIEPDSQ